MNILIIGGGNSGERFVQALLFDETYSLTLTSNRENGKTKELAKKYGLKFILFQDIKSLEKINVIIVSTPYDVKLDIIKNIFKLNFNGSIILEKPIAANVKQVDQIISIVSKRKARVLVAYNRNFDYRFKKNYLVSEEKNTILWPHKIRELSPIIHTLPHILAYLIDVEGSRELKVSKMEMENNGYKFCGKIEDKVFEIHVVVSCTKNNFVTINGNEIEWPKYMITHKNMIHHVTTMSHETLLNILKQQRVIEEIVERYV